MRRIRLGAPLTLSIAAACVAGTYVPGAQHLGVSSGIATLLLPWTWLTLVTWPFIHANTAHLLGNMMLFLLLAPGLEKRQGRFEFLACLAATAVVVGAAHAIFSRDHSVLVGASGWVFMMILLSTFVSGEPGTIAVPTLLVAGLYGWQEIRAAFTASQVSQFAHLLGGACGVVFGYFGSGQVAPKKADA